MVRSSPPGSETLAGQCGPLVSPFIYYGAGSVRGEEGMRGEGECVSTAGQLAFDRRRRLLRTQ